MNEKESACICPGEARQRETEELFGVGTLPEGHPLIESKTIPVESRRKEGNSYSPEYKVWEHMKARCLNPRAKAFHRYGGRGISVCERWAKSFTNFLADMGPRPVGKSIDRIDNDGNYEPGNCRWATQKEQCANSSQVLGARKITVSGECRSLREWGEITKLGTWLIGTRLRRGWTVERAVNTPARFRRK